MASQERDIPVVRPARKPKNAKDEKKKRGRDFPGENFKPSSSRSTIFKITRKRKGTPNGLLSPPAKTQTRILKTHNHSLCAEHPVASFLPPQLIVKYHGSILRPPPLPTGHGCLENQSNAKWLEDFTLVEGDYYTLNSGDLRRRPQAKPPVKFNLKELQVPMGTMAGLIRGDELEVISHHEFYSALTSRTKEYMYRHQLGSFGVTGELALRPIASLSGGQKSRLAFALMAMPSPNYLIFDEPTNHLDVESVWSGPPHRGWETSSCLRSTAKKW